MTSRVARSSSVATRSAATLRTAGSSGTADASFNERATRSPRSVPVASMIATFASDCDDVVRIARTIGRTMTTARKTGPSSVAMTNHFDRTRSRYSRLKTTNVLLAMAGHSLLDALRADPLQEDLVQ